MSSYYEEQYAYKCYERDKAEEKYEEYLDSIEDEEIMRLIEEDFAVDDGNTNG